MIFFRKENILWNSAMFENVFLQVKWVVLIDLWNLISNFRIYGNRSSEKLIILVRMVRVTFDGRVIFLVLPQFQWLPNLVAMPISLEASSQTLWWYSVLQPMGQLKVKFGCFVTMLLVIIALNILYVVYLYMSETLAWS